VSSLDTQSTFKFRFKTPWRSSARPPSRLLMARQSCSSKAPQSISPLTHMPKAQHVSTYLVPWTDQKVVTFSNLTRMRSSPLIKLTRLVSNRQVTGLTPYPTSQLSCRLPLWLRAPTCHLRYKTPDYCLKPVKQDLLDPPPFL
jgi:hypothetical protein